MQCKTIVASPLAISLSGYYRPAWDAGGIARKAGRSTLMKTALKSSGNTAAQGLGGFPSARQGEVHWGRSTWRNISTDACGEKGQQRKGNERERFPCLLGAVPGE